MFSKTHITLTVKQPNEQNMIILRYTVSYSSKR